MLISWYNDNGDHNGQNIFVFSHLVCVVTLNNDVYDIIHKYVNKNLNVNLGATWILKHEAAAS